MKQTSYASILSQQNDGSFMPLDTETHWSWDNPLNLLILLPIIVLVLAVIL